MDTCIKITYLYKLSKINPWDFIDDMIGSSAIGDQTYTRWIKFYNELKPNK
jgi:hypothetical protein